MKNRYLRLVKKQRGFTLIELLAVILILGIIALIAIPTVNNVIKQARLGASESTGNQIVNSTEQYYTMCDLNGGYDKNGNKCPEDLRGTLYSSSELSDVIGVKGDFPDVSDFVVYKKNPDGTAAIVYRKDSFACSNQVDEAGNISYKYTGINNPDGVKCTEKKISGSGNVLLQTDGTKHVMKSYHNPVEINTYFDYFSSSIDEDFRKTGIRENVYEVKFINHINIPEIVSNDKKWDVSEAQDGSIMAWVEPIEENSKFYILYIGSTGDIYANEDSGYLFHNFINVTSYYFGNFKTDDIIQMNHMFWGNDSLKNLDVSSFNTSKVIDMSYTFAGFYDRDTSKDYYFGADEIIGLNDLDVSSVKIFESTFILSKLTYLDLSSWDVSNAESFSSMFYDMDNITKLDLNSWNTSSVKDISYMFGDLFNLKELKISNFNTANVDTLEYTFESLNIDYLDISGWDTSNVTDMYGTFYGTSIGNINEVIKELKTDNVVYMSWMFAEIKNCDYLDLTSFNVEEVEYMNGMFSENLCRVIDISGWNTKSLKSTVSMFNEAYFPDGKVLSSVDSILEEIIGIEDLNTSNVSNMESMFAYNKKIKNLDLSKWNTQKVTSMKYMFYNNQGLETLNLAGWSNNLVTNMSYSFSKMFNLKNINLTNFKTPKVTNMSYMFSGDYRLSTLDVSSFNTSLVTNMSYMFENTLGLTKIDMTGWNTAKVTNMSYMFAGGAPLGDENWQYTKAVNYIGLDNFNTSNVTNFTRMFYRYGGTSLSLPSFNTLKATNMQDMFRTTKLVTLDISSFDTSNVANGKDMFIYNYDIVTIYVGTGWNTSKMIDSPTMFSNCTKLVGAVKFDATKKGISMANYTTGYLTLKS